MWSRSIIVLSVVTLTFAGRGGGHGGRSGGYGGRSGGSHTYPQSHGYSGTGSGGTHSYPHSTGLSGDTHSHVQKTHYAQQNNVNYGHKTEVHHHYHYSPPQQISYGSTHYPVYHASPPVYVYEYRNSGSRFDNLLTGLALYNLGRMSASHHHYSPDREYRSNSGEICKLGISKQNQEYEETRIDCKLMSSFIWDAESERTRQQVVSTNSVTTTTVNVTSNSNGTNAGGNTSVVTTVTAQNRTVVDALNAKGPSINVSPGMNCFMIRISRDSSILKRKIECGVLQAYAQNSLRRNIGRRTTASVVIYLLPLIAFIDVSHSVKW